MTIDRAHFHFLSIFLVLILGFVKHVQADAIKDIERINADLDFGEYLAGECSACHNPNTRSEAANAVPNIHGVQKLSLIENLVAYRSGTRTNSTMRGVAGALSNDEIAAIAAYLASLDSPQALMPSCADDCDDKETQKK